jgi:pimeloyl-ACP methyl ester carboxylesterase
MGAMGARNSQTHRQRLRSDSLNLIETIGQSIANIAPTLTPALNISVVVGMAGIGAWLSYLIATAGLIFVAANIGVLARRHSIAASYFVYIGRALGPLPGMLAGWSMIAAYLFTAIAVSISANIFLRNMLHALGLGALIPPYALFETAFTLLIWACAYRDVRLSSRVGLVLEALSLTIIVILTAIVVVNRGSVTHSSQLQLRHLPMGGVMSALPLAVFSFVGFESSATLAREARNPLRAIPRAVILSATISDPAVRARRRSFPCAVAFQRPGVARSSREAWLDRLPRIPGGGHRVLPRHVCRLNPYPDPPERSFAGIGDDAYLTMNGPNKFTITGNIKSYERTARLHEIRWPALFLCGRYDEASPEATEIYHRALPGSATVIFDQSSHMPFLEEPALYLEVVSDFLRRVELVRR